MSVPFTMGELVEEFLAAAREIVRHGEEAQQSLAERDRQSACNVIAVARYPIAQVGDARDEILKQFELDGITPRIPK